MARFVWPAFVRTLRCGSWSLCTATLIRADGRYTRIAKGIFTFPSVMAPVSFEALEDLPSDTDQWSSRHAAFRRLQHGPHKIFKFHAP